MLYTMLYTIKCIQWD